MERKLDLEIPAQESRAFLQDHARWCSDHGGMSITASRDSSLDGFRFNPMVTTNMSDAPAAPVQKVRFQDIAGNFAAFVKAFPRWAAHAV
jgi:hypothetical protein